MLISQNIADAINHQIGNEFSAFLQYISIASHFENEALPELGRYFFQQADEERVHALRFVKFLVDTGTKVLVPSIPGPEAAFTSAEAAVKLSLDQEMRVGEQINALVQMAKSESDYTTDNFLQWFIQEQLEEISSMDNLLRIVRRAGEDGLLRVEEYLARRKSTRITEPVGNGG